jgi:hypothetical protein
MASLPDMSSEWGPIFSAGVGLLSGLIGGLAGAFMGLKLAQVRLEVWKEYTDKSINALVTTSANHNEDIRVHDQELDGIHEKLGMRRYVRQWLR